jgi:DNA/RNA-binding domain of Phe-tRNA-synthetase-like protein
MSDLSIKAGAGVRGVTLGVLAVENAAGGAGRLEVYKRGLEAELRERYGQLDRAAFKAAHPMDVYVAYYKKYGYTYHVLPQLESVARGKDIPDVLPAVEAMFMAELKNMMLTAAHDTDKLAPPLRLEVSAGSEVMPSLSGKDVPTVPGDFMVTDREGVISAVLRGCDARTAVTEATTNVVYTAYAPEGIEPELVLRHLDDIEAYVRAFAEAPIIVLKEINRA